MSQTPEKAARRWLMGQSRTVRAPLSMALSLGLANAVIIIIQATLIAQCVHALVMEQQAVSSLAYKLLMVAGLVLLRGVCVWGKERAGFSAGAQMRQQVRSALLDKLWRLGPTVAAQRPAGSWSALIVDQVEELQEFYAKYIPQMVLAAAVPVIMLVVIFPHNRVVGLALMLCAPLIPVFMILVGLKAAEANRRNFQALSRLGGFFLDRLQGLPTLILFSRTAWAQQQLATASDDFRRKTLQVLRLAFLSSTVLEFFASVSIAVVAVYLGMTFLGYLTFGGSVTLYTGLFLLLLAPDFFLPLRELGTYYHAKAKAAGAAMEIIDVLSLPGIAPFSGSKTLTDTALSIEATGLTINYKPLFSNQSSDDDSATSTTLLNDLNFTLFPGERVGIIGPSGAGKSTLIQALMGFWPSEGGLKINGESLEQLNIQWWRAQLAWLGQHPLIVDGTLLENIAFGREVSEAQALAALEQAHGLDIVEKLPQGIHSSLKEHGGNLSVGQAQRIALARALALPTPILLLDEPTASVDLASETAIITAFAALPAEMTVITVTHRLEQLVRMDRVLMIEGGELVANGHPEALLQTNAAYQRFVAQAQGSVDHG